MFWSHRTPSILLGTYGPMGIRKYRLPLRSFDTHLYVVGRTKKGKSKFLEQIAFQLMALKQGCGLLDPHSDLAEDLLSYLASQPNSRELLSRVIYFDPSRDDYLLPFNVLKSPGDAYTIAQNVLEAMRRTWPESLREAPRFSNIVLAATIVLVENGLTLVEMPRLLTDPPYREELLAQVSNPEVARFFHDRYDQWGRERTVMVESVLNKVGAFVINPRLRLILGQTENRLPFRQIMDQGRILICNLGRVDAETRRLLGSLIVTGLEQASFSRHDTPLSKRRRFYFVIDEFQDYCANAGSEQTLARILSECRKFGLHLILAHQNQAQLGGLIQGTLENAQVKAVFGVGRGTAETLAQELFSPDLQAVKHQVEDRAQQERTHPTFVPLSEQWEKCVQQLQRLPRRRFLLQVPERKGLVLLKTITVPSVGELGGRLEGLKRRLVKKVGLPVRRMAQNLDSRLRKTETAQISYYEAVDDR